MSWDVVIFSAFALPLLASFFFLMFWLIDVKKLKQSVVAKCAGSFLCMGSAVMGTLVRGDSPLESVFVWALFFCMLGDYLIEIQMIYGGIAFAVAHGLLIGFSVATFEIHLVSVFVFVGTLVITILLLQKQRLKMRKMYLPLLLYLALLIADLAFAVGLPIYVGLNYLPLAIGLFWFVASDILLFKNEFGEQCMRKQRLVMVTYYVAVYLISITAWYL